MARNASTADFARVTTISYDSRFGELMAEKRLISHLAVKVALHDQLTSLESQHRSSTLAPLL